MPLPDDAPDGLEQRLLCRRFPPVLSMIMQPAPLPPGMIPKPGQPIPMMPANHIGQPDTQAEGWCGEWQQAK